MMHFPVLNLHLDEIAMIWMLMFPRMHMLKRDLQGVLEVIGDGVSR